MFCVENLKESVSHRSTSSAQLLQRACRSYFEKPLVRKSLRSSTPLDAARLGHAAIQPDVFASPVCDGNRSIGAFSFLSVCVNVRACMCARRPRAPAAALIR